MRLIMAIRTAICLMFFYFSLFSFPKMPAIAIEKIHIINSFETKNAFITCIQLKGKMYLVKQKKNIKKQLSAVKDALAAYVANRIAKDIAHQVGIIAYNTKFPGKKNDDLPAVLLSNARGETVRKQRGSIFNNLRLRQLWANAPSFEEQGLTHTIINHMSWHPQLALIVALDLFIGNSDRHCGNLFYDPQTDSFCAIDMDDTFNKNLCDVAYKKLELMVKRRDVFTNEEIVALIRMRNHLKYLVDTHKPSALIKKLRYFARQAGFVEGSELYTESIQKKLLLYETMIFQTHVSVYKLISLLNKIVNKGYTKKNNNFIKR
jgi:hypothetical protein